jgi:formamidopyrimidine-DNA glycosylase
MPEGDTIFRAARAIRKALAGRVVTEFDTQLAQLTQKNIDHPVQGRTVIDASSMGKHLLIDFSDDLTLRTHMLMSGSWHLYRPGERWFRPRRDMRVMIATDQFVAVAFNIPIAEFFQTSKLHREEPLRALGPDLLAGEFDFGEAARRIRERAGHEIAIVILTQRVVAGIGNVFKSEILFLAGVNPFDPPARTETARLQRSRRCRRSNRHVHGVSKDDGAIGSGREALGLRETGKAVPQVRYADRVSKAGDRCSIDVLVSELPAAARRRDVDYALSETGSEGALLAGAPTERSESSFLVSSGFTRYSSTPYLSFASL